ncbi:MAG: repeat protein [Gemmataceae bacterium]|nr:repeat protein [Gemmataceae bacterium]
MGMRSMGCSGARRSGGRLRLENLEARDVPAVVGGLDPSFGTGGKFAAFPTASTIGGVAVDVAGRTVLAGSIPGPGGSDFLVIRLNPNGTLDNSFGVGGKAVIDIAGGDDAARGVATDAAGNVVVTGTTGAAGNMMGFVRLKAADGSLDTTFGGGGTGTKVFAPSAGFNNIASNDVLVAPDGGIVATGNSLSAGLKNSLMVVRLTPDGSAVDPTFNGGTIKLIAFQFGVGSDNLGESVVLSGSNIVIGGRTNNGAPGAVNQFAAVRLTANGNFDPAFAGGSVVSFSLVPGTDSTAFAATVDAAGNIYLGGIGGAVSLAGVAKLTPAGDLDPTFGTGGIFIQQVGTAFSEGDGIAVQTSGRVVLTGTAQVSVTGFDFFALQLTPSGTLDPGFNPTGPTPGINRFDFGTVAANFVGASVATPEGRIVIAGTDSTVGGVRAARLIGTVEKGTSLVVGGSTDGRSQVFTPTRATGQYPVTPTATVTAFGTTTTNSRVAAGDVNGDGFPDSILVTGPGVPIRVTVVSGKDNTTVLVPAFDPFGGDFTGGGFVAAGDFDTSGRAMFVVTPDQGGGPRVSIFALTPTGLVTKANFFGIDDPNFRGGARAAAGDVNGDGVPDLAVAAGFGGGPRIALFDGKTVLSGTPTRLLNDFFAFPGTDSVNLRNGAFVAAGDVNGDGFADLISGGGPGGAPRVFILSGQLVAAGTIQTAYNSPVANFFVAGNSADRGGVRVAATDADGDNKADVVAGSGSETPARARVYLGKNFVGTGEPGTFQDLTVFGGATLADGIYVG